MKISSFHDLFFEQLKDLYSAETQLIEALSKMAEKASNSKLKTGFEEHLEQTKEHQNRLKKVAESLDSNLQGHECKAMKGLLEEGKEMIEAEGPDAVIDAGLIASAQRVEHYEIAGYGTAAAMAKLMGHQEALEQLTKTLEEEKETNEKLNSVAEEVVNPAAMEVNSGM